MGAQPTTSRRGASSAKPYKAFLGYCKDCVYFDVVGGGAIGRNRNGVCRATPQKENKNAETDSCALFKK